MHDIETVEDALESYTGKLSRKDFTNLWYASQNWDDVTLYENYSGRFMYGDTCVGFVMDAEWQFPDIVDHVRWNDDSLANDLVSTVRWDNLGRGYIAYFPDLEKVRAK